MWINYKQEWNCACHGHWSYSCLKLCVRGFDTLPTASMSYNTDVGPSREYYYVSGEDHDIKVLHQKRELSCLAHQADLPA
jgi:hypothetical protein